ncbi:MAG: BatD family protein [Chitinophagaceae bacterium]|nr:BatD family protein [Chitinophagaceae bacterium]
MKKWLSIIFFFFYIIGHAQVSDQSEIKKGENIEDKIKKNFFLKAEVTKTSCYVGEPVMATFKAFSRLNASLRVVKRPALTGFSVLEMVDAYNNEPEVEIVAGKTFNTHLIRKVQLFPLQEGQFLLEPAEVESRIFLRNPNMVKYLTLQTPPISITVKALPLKNQPDSFSGAVGNFSVELQMKDRELHQYEPAIAKLVVLGTGNLPLITDPDITWPKGVEVSPPQVTEDVNKYIYPLSGTKIFEYHLETHDPGEYKISPVSFSFFDPAQQKYQTAFTREMKFTVKKGKKKINLAEKIINNPAEIPVQYYYFGAIVLAIIGWIVYQVIRSVRKK